MCHMYIFMTEEILSQVFQNGETTLKLGQLILEWEKLGIAQNYDPHLNGGDYYKQSIIFLSDIIAEHRPELPWH